MAHQPRNYQVLRDEQARALDALNNHIDPSAAPDQNNGVEQGAQQHEPAPAQSAEPEPAPSRPDGPSRFPGGPNVGGMEAHNNWANSYNQQINRAYFASVIGNSAERNDAHVAPTNAEQNATNELDSHIDGQERGGNPIEARRDDLGQDVANNSLSQHVEAQELGSNPSETGRYPLGQEASHDALEHHVDNQEQRQPENVPQEAVSWDAFEARVGGESAGRGAPQEELDKHIESPDLQPNVQRQPGSEIEV